MAILKKIQTNDDDEDVKRFLKLADDKMLEDKAGAAGDSESNESCYVDFSCEDDLSLHDHVGVARDFSAWDNPRKPVSVAKKQKQKALRNNSPTRNLEQREPEEDGGGGVMVENGLDESIRLTEAEEEKKDIAAWKGRLDFDMAFDKNYVLDEFQQKEMDAIFDFLGLEDPESHAEYLSKPEEQVTRKAITSIFSPRPNERHSILLKRGHVLFNGEERELMLFTNGFLLSHVEVDALLNLFLDATSGRIKTRRRARRLNQNELYAWRFSEMDKDGSGSVDDGELHEFFRTMGVSLSKEVLDTMMKRFDFDSDGSVSYDEFKKLMQELQQCKETKNDNRISINFWKGWRKKMKNSFTKNSVTLKLDIAFQMSDIERIDNLGFCFVIHLKDVSEPLVVKGSTPGHVEAWVNAFNKCSKSAYPQDDEDVGDDESSTDDNLAAIEKMNVAYDMIAWTSFRKFSERKLNNKERFELTDEEIYDNKAWRMRLQVDEVFCKGYKPKKWEKKEMGAIVEFLGLQNPNKCRMHLNGPHRQLTRKAIASLFYQESTALQSVLLKRGPVMIGEEERELMLFTHGFLLWHAKLDVLVNLLLDASSGRIPIVEEELTEAEFCQRRFSDIDTDCNGSLNRDEIHDFFRSMGMALSDSMLDGLVEKFDFDSDGTVSFGEFKTIVLLIQEQNDLIQEQNDKGRRKSFWEGLSDEMDQCNLAEDGVTRKLDVAFQMTDIERVENIGTCDSHETKMLVDPELEKRTFVLYLKDVPDPLVVRCSKPGHVVAWVDAFRKCLRFDAKKDVSQLRRPEWATESIDWESMAAFEFE